MFHAVAFALALALAVPPWDLAAQVSARVFARATVRRAEADADLLAQVRRIAAYGEPHNMRVGVATLRAQDEAGVARARLPLPGATPEALWIAERRRRVVTVDFVRN